MAAFASSMGGSRELPLHRRDIQYGPRRPSRSPRAPSRHQQPYSNGTGRKHGSRSRRKGRPRVAAATNSSERRTGFNIWKFLTINFRSASYLSCAVNVLWPFVPAALVVRYTRNENHLTIFVLAYLAMVPCANLIGFAGQELARKLPHVYGVLTEVTLGSVVEIVMFQVLLSRSEFVVIKAAILGSILATMLLCMGLVFFFGGLRHSEQHFDEAISEAGSGLLLVA